MVYDAANEPISSGACVVSHHVKQDLYVLHVHPLATIPLCVEKGHEWHVPHRPHEPCRLCLLLLQYFYYFGLERIIKKLFDLPEFVKHRATARTQDNLAGRSTWWGSPSAQRIHDKTGGRLFDLKNSPYTLSFDFVNVFSFKDWSTGVASLRCGRWQQVCLMLCCNPFL